MFCPYIRKQYMRITGIHYNDDGVEDGSVIAEHFENMECPQEKCGAWYKGRCEYNERQS